MSEFSCGSHRYEHNLRFYRDVAGGISECDECVNKYPRVKYIHEGLPSRALLPIACCTQGYGTNKSQIVNQFLG